MRRRRLPSLLFAALAALALLHVAHADAHEGDEDASMVPAPPDGTAQYTSTPGADDSYRITTRFRTFAGEALTLGFALPAAAGRASLREFGIADAELEALLRDCEAQSRCDQRALDAQTTRYYREHALGLRAVPGEKSHLFVDVGEVVRRNRGRVQPVAAALRDAALRRGRDTQWMIEAAVALVQGGIAYRKPSMWEGGRKILGFYPPPRALERGYGDCDTKSALLAAILQNLTDTPIIGVHVPQHYLLGIAGRPHEGQAAIRHAGRSYILVEAAGPAQRRPGDVAQRTREAIDDGSGLRIDPI